MMKFLIELGVSAVLGLLAFLIALMFSVPTGTAVIIGLIVFALCFCGIWFIAAGDFSIFD